MFVQRNHSQSASQMFGDMAYSMWINKMWFVFVWAEMWRKTAIRTVRIDWNLGATSSTFTNSVAWSDHIFQHKCNCIANDCNVTSTHPSHMHVERIRSKCARMAYCNFGCHSFDVDRNIFYERFHYFKCTNSPVVLLVEIKETNTTRWHLTRLRRSLHIITINFCIHFPMFINVFPLIYFLPHKQSFSFKFQFIFFTY